MQSLNRVVMRRETRQWIEALDPPSLRVAEISGSWGEDFAFGTYRRLRYPNFDICQGPLLRHNGQPLTFDMVIADQVWEHLERPLLAARHARKMLKPGGHFLVASPFLVPYHAAPIDCSRWTAEGMAALLADAGFPPDGIRTGQWGNRAAVIRNLGDDWPPEWRPDEDPLDNDPRYPVMVWALARKRPAAGRRTE